MGTVWEQNNIHRVLQRVLHSKNPTEMDTITSLLLTGQVTSQDLPSVTSRLVRVFLCSTGVDTCTERTAFVEQVYPKMREYCRRYYDLEFQMVDLAWGLTADQLCSDPDFTALSLEEIDNCRNTSCGPCFLAFIGQNYGPRPLPTSILAKHYNAMKSAVVNDRGRDSRNVDIIDQFYVIDTNSVPPVYLIKPDNTFPELNHEDKHERRLARERWEEIQPELRYLLQKGAVLAFQGKSDTTAMEGFFISDLEKEVRRGLEQCEDPATRCVLILRDIVDLKNYVDDPKAPAFIQITLVPPAEAAESDRNDSLESSLNLFNAEVSQGSADFRNRLLLDTSTASCLQDSVDSLQLNAEAEICPKCLRRVVKPGPEQEKTRAVNRLRCRQLVDVGAEDQLRLLRSRVGAVVPEANTLRHEVLWKYEEVISPRLHHDYLKKLCTGTWEALRRLIDNCSKTVQNVPHLPPEAQECLQHWTRCRSLTADLCPCHAPLRQQLRDYVTGVLGHPLVLYGECGSGKTKMVSALAMELSELIPGRRVCTIRYVGLTAGSAGVFPLLRSLCCQICTVLGLDPLTVPGDWQHLRSFFPRFIAALPAEVTVVVVVVGLEKLLLDPDAQLTHWLPSQLPQNVKFILTFTVDHRGIQTPVQSAKDLFKDYPSSLLQMKPLTLRDAEVLLNHFLSAAHRRISQEQMAVFRERFQDCSLPLYVKLLSLQARTLHSFSNVSCLGLPLDTSEAVHAFFDRLEISHHREVVSHALSYMAASQSGVSDAEMEDLLSLDDIVLKSVSNHDHNRRRVPCAVWVKIRRDLEPFLLVQQADGLNVTVWEHESFGQAARLRYFHHRDDITSAHSLMADYFLGTWAGREKAVNPVEITDTCTPPCGVKTDRLVPAQPHMFFYDPVAEQHMDSPQLQPISNNHGRQSVSISQSQTRLNKRLYSQLPRHLQLSGRVRELKQLVLFNYSWIFNRIKGYSLSCCLGDFLLIPGPETNLVRTALQEASPILEEDLQNLAAELSGRLLPYCCTYPWIRTLVHSCDLQGLQHCVLVPSFPYHQIPGSPRQNTLDCGFVPYDLTLVHNDFYLLCKHLRRCEVLVWDMRSGELKDTIFTSQGTLYVTPNVKYFLIMDRETEKSFKIHEAGSGEFVGQIVPENDVGKDIRNNQHVMSPLSLSDNRLCVVVVAVAGTILCVYQVPSGRSLYQVPLPGLATVCQLTVSLQHVLCSADDALLVCATDGMREVNTVALPAKPHLLAVTGDERVAVLAFLPDQCMILHINYGQEVHTFPVPTHDTLHGEVIRAVRVAPDDQHVLVRADSHVLVYVILPDQTVPMEMKSCVSPKPYGARLVADYVRPVEIPAEYRLPSSHYRDLVFTAAEFSADTQCVLTAIFRHVYVWRIADHSLLTTLQTPMGITSSLLVSKTTNQLLTHNEGSSHVIMWSHMTSTRDSTRLQQDRLSRPVQRVLVTSDQRLAFAQCRQSDEIGVFDMGTGLLTDLLTHTSEVIDMAITPTGDVVLVITETRLSGTACRLWYLPRRKVIKEWADSASYSISMHAANSLIVFTQPRCPSLCSPYSITLLRFKHGLQHFTENHCPDACKYIAGARPVVTRDDRFLAVTSALGWDNRKGRVVSPCLMVFDCDTDLRSKCFDDSRVGLEDRLDRILQVEACPLDKSSVALIISVKGKVTKRAASKPEKSGDESSLKLALLMLDLKQSARTSLIFLNMPPPESFPHRLIFSQDFSLCLDQASTIHDITSRASHEDYLPHPGAPPQCLALNSTVVVYFSDCWLYVLRLFDARVTARCHMHDLICHVTLCSDQRTLVVGCRDGKLTSYVIVDPVLDSDPSKVVSRIPSRQMAEMGIEGKKEGQVRRWDEVDVELAPAYSRPPSARSAEENNEQKALRGVKPLTLPRCTESILRPIPCKCVRKNEQGRWEKVKEVKVGFKR